MTAGPATALATRVCVVSGALPGFSLREVLSALTAVGVDAVELTAGPGGHLGLGEASAVAESARLLAQSGVRLCGIDAPAETPLGSDGLVGILQTAALLHAPFVRVYPPRFEPTVPVDVQLAATSTALDELAHAAAPDTAILLEPAPGSIAPSPELARQVVLGSTTAATGVVFDPGSMVAEGHLQPRLALAVLADLVRHVHVKNRSLVRRGDRWLPRSHALGSGVVDWIATLGELHRRRYRGWLSIDHLSGPPGLETLRTDVAELRRLAGVAVAPTDEGAVAARAEEPIPGGVAPAAH